MNTDKYQPEGMISGDSAEDTTALRKMAAEVRDYLSLFRWCPPIKELYLAKGVGDVVAVFLVQFLTAIAGKDEYLWVIVGDLPSAYLVLDEIKTPSKALERYCELMSDWADAVLQKKSLSTVFPVRAGATEENALALQKRLKFLRERVIPMFET